jgi:hypothetical protein
MTVYVDDWRQPARVGQITARWSHLTVGPDDDLAELHAFATRIGLRRAWFQDKPWPRAHYDVTDSKRREAIAAGAVSITSREAGQQRTRAIDARRQADRDRQRPVVNPEPPYGAEVRAYLDDCAAHPGLDRRYHPTADGAVKVIWHSGSPDEAEQIRSAFRTITANPDINVAPATVTPGPQGRAANSANRNSSGDDPNALTAA